MQTKGVILAGGRSERMGCDKALLLYKGISLLEHTKNMISSLGIDDITIIGRPDDMNGVADTEGHQGPAINLQHWLNAQTLPFRILVLPVDMPFLGKEQLNFLLSNKDGAYFDDLYLPFSAVIRDSIGPRISRMKDLLAHMQVIGVHPPPEWQKNLVNINNSADLTLLNP